MPTALPTPVKAATASGNASSGPKAAAALQKMEAAYNRMRTMASKVGERKEAITEGVILTAEIQAGTFAASFLSGYLQRKGKSLKVMGVDMRPVTAGAMIVGGLAMDKGGEHLLALGNGVMASWTAELAFDLGVKMATPKGEAAAPVPATGPTTAGEPYIYVGADETGDETGDEIGARGGRRRKGGGKRRMKRRPQQQQQASSEEEEEAPAEEPAATGDEVGGLWPQDRVNAHYKKWKTLLAKSKKATNSVRKEKLKADADAHAAKGKKIWKANRKKVVLPGEWKKWAKKTSTTSTDTEEESTRNIQFRRRSEEDSEWDDDGDALDEAVNSMDEDEYSSMAGDDIGDGDMGDETGDDMGDELGDDMGDELGDELGED